MRSLSLGTLLVGICLPAALAIPQSFFGNGFFGPVIPATPRFGKNLTGEFLNLAHWEKGELPGPWEEAPAFAGRQRQRMSANPILFGAVPSSVVAWTGAGELREIEIQYLDAGSFFGFKAGGERSHQDREAGAKRRAEFADHFAKHEADLRQRLEAGCGSGAVRRLGSSELLQQTVTDYRWEGFLLRLVAREGHSLGLSIFRYGAEPGGYLNPELAALDSSRRAERLADAVVENERSDILSAELPVVQQGHTPFCGVGSLAMAAGALGLQISQADLEWGAGFRNTGSARGSRVLDLYRAVAEELGMRVTISSKFDPRRVRKSIEAGIPVVVWRRVSEEREAAHRRWAKRVAAHPGERLPEPGRADRRDWPERKKQSLPSHGSVVGGINLDRSEVVYSEPWGEAARNRRMRVEEMEATAYAVFYFRF